MNRSFEHVGNKEVTEFPPELPEIHSTDHVSPNSEIPDDSKAVELVDLQALAETFSADDPIRLYLTEIAKVPPLADDEESELLRTIESGAQAAEILRLCDSETEYYEGAVADLKQLVEDGKRARQRLAEANLHLVVSIAMEYFDRGLLLLDLLQEGNLGLIKAVETFDFAKSTSFIPYATYLIRSAISFACTPPTPRVPPYLVETINRVLLTERQLLQELGYPPSAEEVAAAMKVPADQIHTLLRIARDPVGPEPPVETDPAFCTVSPSAETLEQLKESLSDVLPLLTPREQKVLKLRFGIEDGHIRTPEEIGKEFNVSRERIRQIEAKALRKLRHLTAGKKQTVASPAEDERLRKLKELRGEAGEHVAPTVRPMRHRPRNGKLKDYLE